MTTEKSSPHSEIGECSKRPLAKVSLARLRARQDAGLELDVQAASGQGVVDGLALEAVGPLPKLAQFAHMRGQHVAREDQIEIVDEVIGTLGLEEFDGLVVDGDDPDRSGGHPYALRIGFEMRPDVGHPLGAPAVEQPLDRAEILQPERQRRELEQITGRVHLRAVVQGHGFHPTVIRGQVAGARRKRRTRWECQRPASIRRKGIIWRDPYRLVVKR